MFVTIEVKDGDTVAVNADQITHIMPDGDGASVIYLAGVGAPLYVESPVPQVALLFHQAQQERPT